MKKRILRAAATLISAALLSCQIFAMPSVAANSAVLMDAATKRVLWSKDEDRVSLIASTTKIMTALLVVQECDVQAEVSIPQQAVGIEGSSIYLREGERLTVEVLLYGMMLQSGNDAAVALAIYCGGSIEGFVEKMNAKASELGLKHTKFANPHGLDAEDNHSTAYDLAVLTAYAMEEPLFAKVVSSKTAAFGERSFVNHNKLLWRYPGAVGVKTGYTMAAGRILVSCSERDGRRLIAVTIDDPNDWKDHQRLLDYGFDAYHDVVFAKADSFETSVPVIGGAEEMCRAVLKKDLVYPVTEKEEASVRVYLPEFVYPPVIAGERAGELSVYLDGVKVASQPLYWSTSVLEGA